jgi:cytochrome c556
MFHLKLMVLSLKNKILTIVSLLAFVFLLENCSENKTKKTEEVKSDSIASCVKPLNPNGDSELALLMREMMSSASNMRELIKQGNLPKEFPAAFLKIHTAKPTDSDTKKASFDNFANNYISNLQTLYASPKEDLTKNYNAVVNACASCHSEHCPGPLKAINKLKIE